MLVSLIRVKVPHVLLSPKNLFPTYNYHVNSVTWQIIYQNSFSPTIMHHVDVTRECLI